ncbi:PEP-CTERM sorting domain-containing protein [Geobacter benzoatilyticus]|uniref:PEP-CTERM sorting domain-containing protein n=1 Tax=Geobacter benzoatilyticus TaxID=2815309 RepID=A0ABX7Q4H5_9BACT|nr:PEP-CTERM sorting domain-containing protein [Geobacter benzoatilyticus]
MLTGVPPSSVCGCPPYHTVRIPGTTSQAVVGDPTPVPEPSTLLLVIAGSIGFIAHRIKTWGQVIG